MDLLQRVPDEPPPSHPECVCVVFKMPDGRRVERRFLHTHTLEVFTFVKIIIVKLFLFKF